MSIISINGLNIDSEHICCAIGNDQINQARALVKKQWMKDRFEEGLVFKRLDERGKVFIEYMPVETAWKPISGRNFMVINCLWVSGQFKGKGYSKQLLNECIIDSQEKGMDGIAVVTGTSVKPFLTDRKFFLKHGFVNADTAPPHFELLVLKWNEKAENPKFTSSAKDGISANAKGFTFIYSNQCPFMQEYVSLLCGVLQRKNISSQTILLDSFTQAQQTGSAFGTFGVFYNGKLITHELMSEIKFEKLLVQMNL